MDAARVTPRSRFGGHMLKFKLNFLGYIRAKRPRTLVAAVRTLVAESAGRFSDDGRENWTLVSRAA